MKYTDNKEMTMDTIIIKIYGLAGVRIHDRTEWVPELIKRRTYEDLTPTEKRSVHPYLRKFVHHPKREAAYQPKVELFETLSRDQRNVQYVLRIEFSVPKLLYGNSLEEAIDATKDEVVSALIRALSRISIDVTAEALEKASVSGVHFCKNILLPRDIRMREVLKELACMDISKTVDVMSKQFKNGGKVLNIYSGTVERSFYDKIADAHRPKNKRSDKKLVGRERGIIDTLDLQGREMFRYEYRIKMAQTVRRDINAILKRDKKSSVVFEDLFVPELSKAMLLASWDALTTRPENQLALIGPTDNLALFLHILSEAKKKSSAHSLNNALIAYGLTCAIRDHGAKEVRGAIFSLWNADHSERLTKRMAAATELTRGLPYSNCVAHIDAALHSFVRITRNSLENVV